MWRQKLRVVAARDKEIKVETTQARTQSHGKLEQPRVTAK